MLVSLSIKNFALIEKSSIDFSDGLTTITGETGAGKSILLGALGLLLGKRAEQAVLKNKEEKCIVEASFSIADYNLTDFFETAGLDYDDTTIIRREILPNGKSRAFVNDSPVNLQDLADLTAELIDIHSQQQTRELAEEKLQFHIIDAVAGHGQATSEFKNILKQYRSDKKQFAAVSEQLAAASREQDYNAFLLHELDEAQLTAGSQEILEETMDQLQNVGFIRETFSKVLALSEDEQIGALPKIKEMRQALNKLAPLSRTYADIAGRMESLTIELDDICSEINTIAYALVDDPDQLASVTSRLETIYALQKKHQVSGIDELMLIKEALQSKLHSLEDLQFTLDELQRKADKSAESLKALAGEIRANRRKVIPILSAKLTGILSNLGMPNAQFRIELTESEAYQHNGMDLIEFKFSGNKGSDFGLLKKVASGGEMSRIMLAIKSVLSEYSKLPTIIFDEIDTGVSGEVANSMGDIMVRMSKAMQVFVITHLPQVAAKGTHHFRVFKQVVGDKTQSDLKLLTPDERVVEIAEMLSGKSVSDSAINHAKALLN